MKEELLYQFPYQKEFTSIVKSCTKKDDKYEVILEDTLFYPEGGGQPADHGTIAGITVEDVQRKDGVIVHTMKKPLETGSEVTGEIDWDYRFDLMQNHTGEHIVSGICHNLYGCENIGFHMSDVITIDLSCEISWNQLKQVEVLANEAVTNNVPVEITYPSDAELSSLAYRSKKELTGEVRIVTIPGVDVCACCGMHVKTTGEIGFIRILSAAKTSRGTRIEMLSGKRALLYDQNVYDDAVKTGVMLSVPAGKSAEAVDKLLFSKKVLQEQYQKLLDSYFEMKIQTLEENSPFVLWFEEDLDRPQMIRYADRIMKEKSVQTAGIFVPSGDGYQYVLFSTALPLREYIKVWNQELHGRGGGKDEAVQGFFSAKKEDIIDLITEERICL